MHVTDAPVTIGGRRIGVDQPPFVIAEMSGNHNGSLETAIEIVRAAAAAGAHALKLQTYTADTMTLDLARGEFYISDPSSLWHGRSLYELYREAATPWDWHRPIFDLCRELGMIAFSTPFDASAIEFLESLGAPCYKIASFENIDLPLIRQGYQAGVTARRNSRSSDRRSRSRRRRARGRGTRRRSGRRGK